MTKNRNHKQAVRALAAATGVSYTTALRALERGTAPSAPAEGSWALRHPDGRIWPAHRDTVLGMANSSRELVAVRFVAGRWQEHTDDTATGAAAVPIGTAADGAPVSIDLTRSWVITGGPAAGKTVLARRIAQAAAAHGMLVHEVDHGGIKTTGAIDTRAAQRTLLLIDGYYPGATARQLHKVASKVVPDEAVFTDAAARAAAGVSIVLVSQQRSDLGVRMDGHIGLYRGAVLIDDHAFQKSSDVRLGDTCVHADKHGAHCLRGADEHASEPLCPQNPPRSYNGTLTEAQRTVDFTALPATLHGPDLSIGDRVQFAESRRWWKVRAVSPSGRYVGLSSPDNLRASNHYTVIDRRAAVRGPDDRVFSQSWKTDEDFAARLRELDFGHMSISRRHRVDLDVVAVRPPS